MWALARKAVGAGVLVTAAWLSACTVQSDSSTAAASGGAAGGGGWGAPPAQGAPPALVDVDPNRTMTAQPGQGVGVFTEYMTGGHWHVWWTCDTDRSGLGCSFDVSASVDAGSIANLAGENLEAGDSVTATSATAVDAVTQTSTGTDGMTFDTAPGQTITLDAKVNGIEDGTILFFVQDGRVNGGYAGAVADPLMLEPAAP